MNDKKMSISAFFPAYNDAGTIASMVVTTLLTLREVSDDYEVVVINDGSRDHTPQVLDELARVYPGKVRIIHHPKNRGYGGALRSGFASATREWIFYTDGDAQYDPRELKNLVALVNDHIDFVNGWKIERNDPLHRIVIGRIYQYVIKILFRLKLKDVDCDFRLMRRTVFDKVQLHEDSGVICVELMKKVQDNGFALAETPVHHYHRAYGKSQFFNFRRLFRVALDLIRLWWRFVVQKQHLKESAPLPLETGQPEVSRQ
ncbi:MAG: glycosyltransferase family 2 protein [Chloroflexi bacterium]|nr:glycosyltransferase family 2 protein [Chloroflexota bacterium]MCI0576124.1 glycosyltransferase family 2 protein [Chloroflexota bacterium]MCI0647912.1 glycosyltransferase family 2 protein [Chloroflexota bacterium]MCI0727163.1 glycosyltransferase family 2 protein [Chloroflexota bacterium]